MVGKELRRSNGRKKKVVKKNSSTVSSSNMEPNTRNEQMATSKATPLASRCSCKIHSKRKRLCDADGISAKAVIDGLVNGGILQDDSTQYVKEVRFSQEKTKGAKEETIIELWEELD
jgi:Holliday junction resolvase RusA-like endonuclease